MPGSGLILAIESSCDETAAAVVRSGREVLANVVASQIALHANYGGVVPELASREHLRNIVPVVRAAMTQAGVTFAALDAIAVTEGPGLAGALLVGITYAKALALGLGKPLIAVNHLEGHIHAVLMESVPPATSDGPPQPLLALVVSGGHTHLYLAQQVGAPHLASEMWVEAPPSSAPGVWAYRNVGRTVDDAAGEAFDKVAKLLGLGYPGGPWIDSLAPHGNPHAVEFRFQPIKIKPSQTEGRVPHVSTLRHGPYHHEIVTRPTFDFSFSGIKTAVLRYVQNHAMQDRIAARRASLAAALQANPALRPADALTLLPDAFDRQTLDLIASFQHAVVGNLIRQTFAAADAFAPRAILISGGVAANRELRRRFTEEAGRRNLPVAFPSLALSTDNAAMIAAAAWPKFLAHTFAPEDLVPTPQLKLGASDT